MGDSGIQDSEVVQIKGPPRGIRSRGVPTRDCFRDGRVCAESTHSHDHEPRDHALGWPRFGILAVRRVAEPALGSPGERSGDVMKSGSRWVSRLALVLGSTVFVFGVVELGLAVAFGDRVDSLLASRDADWVTADRRALCIGDSYTFGLYYPTEESFPARLEAMLNERGEQRWAVVNRGIPAQNTAQMVAALPRHLEAIRPELVIILGGHNNRWNRADPVRTPALLNWWNDRILVRLVKLALAEKEATEEAIPGLERITEWGTDRVGVEGGAGAETIEIRKTGKRRNDQETYELCVRDFDALATLCKEAGAHVILNSYPSPEPDYGAPSQAAQEVAARHQVPFVDHRTLFGELLEDRAYNEILIPGDRHPTHRGYAHMARAILQAMHGRGWIEAGWGEDEPLAEELHPLTLKFGEDRSFEVTGPPGAKYQIALSRSQDPPFELGSRRLPVTPDDLFHAAYEWPELKGSFDADGVGKGVLTEELSGRLFAVLVVFYDHQIPVPDLTVRGVSAGVEVSW